MADDPGGDVGFRLGDLFAVILSDWKTVAGITLLFVFAGFFYAISRDRPYLANTRILINPQGIQVLDRDVVRNAESSESGVAIVESQMRVLTSESVLQQVIDRENLTDDPEFAENSGSIIGLLIRELTGGTGTTADTREIKTLFNLADAVRASRPQRSYIVDLYVKTTDPQKSARLANAIAETYIASEAASRSGIARDASTTLSARLTELRRDLTDAENAIEQYKLQNNILDSNGSPINEQELEQLNRLLVEAEGRTELARSNLEQIEAARASASDLSTIPEALNSSTISGLRIRLATALQRRSVLSAELLPSHPGMAAADAQVNVITQQIEQELSRIVGRARADLARSEAEQHQIENRLEATKQSTFVTNDARVQLRDLTRDADAKRAVYQAFLLRAKELGEQERVNTLQARVISSAVPPLRPSGLPSILILGFAGVVGMAFGMGTALARAFLALRPTSEPARDEAPKTGFEDHEPQPKSHSTQPTFDTAREPEVEAEPVPVVRTALPPQPSPAHAVRRMFRPAQAWAPPPVTARYDDDAALAERIYRQLEERDRLPAGSMGRVRATAGPDPAPQTEFEHPGHTDKTNGTPLPGADFLDRLAEAQDRFADEDDWFYDDLARDMDEHLSARRPARTGRETDHGGHYSAAHDARGTGLDDRDDRVPGLSDNPRKEHGRFQSRGPDAFSGPNSVLNDPRSLAIQPRRPRRAHSSRHTYRSA